MTSFGELRKWFNLFATRIHDVVAGVRLEAEKVALAPKRIPDANPEILVGNLATRATVATDNIAASTKTTQPETKSSVNRFTLSTGKVETGVAKVRAAGESLDQIVASPRVTLRA